MVALPLLTACWFLVEVGMERYDPEPLYAPFEAEREEVRITKDPDGTRRQFTSRSKVYRDGAGRGRTEHRVPTERGGSQHLAFIVDPRTHDAVLVDVDSGEIVGELPRGSGTPVPPSPPSPGPANRPPPPGKGRPVVENLGTKVVEGLLCRGRRFVFEDGTIEMWDTSELGPPFPVFERLVTATDEYESHLLEIRLGEPDPALFRPLDHR